MRDIARSAAANRAANSLLATVFLTVVVLQFGSMAILRAEDDAAGSNIHTASDAIWWCYVTITTVGYGDRYPVTNLGRNIGVVVLTIGVGLFGVLTGFMANLFLSPKQASDQGPADQIADLRLELEKQGRQIAELLARTPGAGEPDAADSAATAAPAGTVRR